MKITNILASIDMNSLALPEFQRGFVWKRDQVRSLMSSLYRGYPIGSLLEWITNTDTAAARGVDPMSPGAVHLLLDGQQRLTSLYGMFRGEPPAFFDGDRATITGLQFHLEDKAFEFYSASKMKDDPLWVDVTETLKDNGLAALGRIGEDPDLAPKIGGYAQVLAQLANIGNIELHIDQVIGEDDIDVVVEIFNRVNSGGTKLSSGDLALARISAAWPDARPRMKNLLSGWAKKGYGDFDLDWLLRTINAVTNGRAEFGAFKSTTIEQFKDGLMRTEKAIDALLNLVSSRLGLDHGRVLAGRYAFPVMARFVSSQPGGKVHDLPDQNKLLWWYVQSFLWGRFSGSTESVLNRDLAAVDSGGLDGLLQQLRLSGLRLEVIPEDFAGYSLGARFYPMLYLLTRVEGARNFCDGLELKAHLLGANSSLHVHHIFPKAQLYTAGYGRAQVNSVSNFCFLTAACNYEVTDRLPEEYFVQYETNQPGALSSQWIPPDIELRKISRYPEFLLARQELLADAANAFLDTLIASLGAGTHATTTTQPISAIVTVEEDDARLDEVDADADRYGFARPERSFVLLDAADGRELGVADVAWPRGVQEGLTAPVALILDNQTEELAAFSQAGYVIFAEVASLTDYLRSLVEGEKATVG